MTISMIFYVSEGSGWILNCNKSVLVLSKHGLPVI